MRVTVSLHEDDVAFLDKCVEDRRFASRSAVIQGAIRLMRSASLVDAYTGAFTEWADSEQRHRGIGYHIRGIRYPDVRRSEPGQLSSI